MGKFPIQKRRKKKMVLLEVCIARPKKKFEWVINLLMGHSGKIHLWCILLASN